MVRGGQGATTAGDGLAMLESNLCVVLTEVLVATGASCRYTLLHFKKPLDKLPMHRVSLKVRGAYWLVNIVGGEVVLRRLPHRLLVEHPLLNSYP